MTVASMRSSFSFARASWFTQEAISVAAGLAFTGGLFLTMARFESAPIAAPTTTIEDLKLGSVPFEPPPPKPVETSAPEEAPAVSFAGLEAGATDSSIKIAVTPPDLASIFPVSDVPPAATIDVRRLYTDLRPKSEIEANFDRIYQRSEVDQPPHVISRDTPSIPSAVRGDAPLMRLTALILVDQRGQVGSVRVLKPSGNAAFDEIIVDSIKTTWVFSPAIKSGKQVRCLAQQVVTVKWSSGSPFTLQ